MTNLHNITGKRLSKKEISSYLNSFLEHIKESNCEPYRIYLFGSGARGEMTEQSDLDVVIVYKNQETLKAGKLCYYQLPFLKIPVDAVFVTVEQFKEQSKKGGVCWMCEKEGRIIYEEESQSHG